jgi:CheY-like chemotaxis protein
MLNIVLSIVDVNLPDSEDEVLNYLLKKNIPSIAMTSSFNQKLRDKIIDKHIVDYIVLEDDQQLELLQATVNRIMSNEHRKILIVDDSKSSRFALKNLLQFQNFTILEASNAKNALILLRDNTDINIAFIDYEMPGMNGADLARIIRQNSTRMELSIFAISSHTESIITVEFLKAGANDFITKPYIKEEVLARIGVNIDIMDQHKLLQQEIKERKIVEKKLKNSQIIAQNANRAKSNFLANMSHEVRTPMNAIVGFIDILCKDEKSTKRLDQLNIVKQSGGSGLGLSISRSLAKLMNGSLNVESELNVGSKFNFDLDTPIKGNILLVEDNKSNQLLMSILLQELGIDVDIAGDGVQGVKMFEEKDYDIILMDENMPNMNGTEATNIIRQNTAKRQIPIIAVTANALKGDKERFLVAGMNDYISKPIDSTKLETTLRRFLPT